MKNFKKSGFTLVEIVICLLLISLMIVAILTVNLQYNESQSKTDSNLKIVNVCSNLVECFYACKVDSCEIGDVKEQYNQNIIFLFGDDQITDCINLSTQTEVNASYKIYFSKNFTMCDASNKKYEFDVEINKVSENITFSISVFKDEECIYQIPEIIRGV